METIVKKPKDIAEAMAEDEKKVEEYVRSGDKTKKPAGVKFVKLFTLSPR